MISNTIIADAIIILNFLSFTGIPNIQTYQSKIPKLRKIFQYMFFALFLCVFMLKKIYRSKKSFNDSKNIAIETNVISTAVLSLILKVFLIINIKKLNSVSQCFWEFMLRYQVIYISMQRAVTRGCFVSFQLYLFFVSFCIFPILIYLCSTLTGVPTEFHGWIFMRFSFVNENLKIIMYCLLDIGNAIIEYTYPLITYSITVIFVHFFLQNFIKTLCRPTKINAWKSDNAKHK